MESIKFTGNNIDEIKKFTGCNVDMHHTEVRNCSEQFPEGFDYPYASVHTMNGTVKLSLQESISKNLEKVN
jgi:histidinol phosphatase-like PHP family hydrolase